MKNEMTMVEKIARMENVKERGLISFDELYQSKIEIYENELEKYKDINHENLEKWVEKLEIEKLMNDVKIESLKHDNKTVQELIESKVKHIRENVGK